MEIKKPKVETYYICIDEDNKARHHGSVKPNRCLKTADKLETFISKKKWIERLNFYGVKYEDKNYLK
ncbi:hypothetical protein [Polaribacter sp. IC073]|uniref:hypothetical protein n=1 Tax=Polaribacter sp. IC073 TaxID=2508540 RepID=UPI0011BECE69|nr:hypothetical protein [Polaribacter sp. IC073]TXD47334.1 hypothetical protein ES045_12110 [Polaribacter sp. IC073]